MDARDLLCRAGKALAILAFLVAAAVMLLALPVW